jgi:hypothetical protein
MRPLFNNYAVRYVTEDGSIVDGTITEVFPPDMAHVQFGEKHLALARYSIGKEPNTFHFEDEELQPERPKPFKPGAKAWPDKPQPKGAPAPLS